MKNKKAELDVDFVGGQGALTKEEELALSKFIREHKAKHAHKHQVKRRAKIFSDKKQHAA